ncbi:MAG: cardiolipin synthase [Deltaproteobacteria bacterium]|nr:cardiolipin synthase [Deltaproteobacteria bacterium]
MFIFLGHMLLAAFASAHIILHKRNTGSAIAWIGLVWLSPYLGSLLYFIFGINRIYRKACSRKFFRNIKQLKFPEAVCKNPTIHRYQRISDSILNTYTTEKNEILPLESGSAAYNAILESIDAAKNFIFLETYIFDNDRSGKIFADKLEAALKRGVKIKVLVDAAGTRYSKPPIQKLLREKLISTALFGRKNIFYTIEYANLRNHRKLLIVDGDVAFSGGMNIREGYLEWPQQPVLIHDLHFQFKGLCVQEFQKVFVEDWWYETGEDLSWSFQKNQASLPIEGKSFVRLVPDGPDQKEGKSRQLFLSAAVAAHKSIQIITPYFVPDENLIEMLKIAARSGIEVEIILPAENNLNFVQWASTSILDSLIEAGCKIYLSNPPFDHTKLMIVDSVWVYTGSANWDQRSLRLNFELNFEIVDEAFASKMENLFKMKQKNSKKIELQDLQNLPLWVRLRNSLVYLGQPYL